jgi:hypothetical protein
MVSVVDRVGRAKWYVRAGQGVVSRTNTVPAEAMLIGDGAGLDQQLFNAIMSRSTLPSGGRTPTTARGSVQRGT